MKLFEIILKSFLDFEIEFELLIMIFYTILIVNF